MRLNKYLAAATGMSRRAADLAIAQKRVMVDGVLPSPGLQIIENATVTLDGAVVMPVASTLTIMLNKPTGYVVSRVGQGSRTIYELLPGKLHYLKPIGRLDKDSSGLLLLTDDGTLAHQLTHPSFQKTKLYEILLDKPLQPLHRQMISDHGLTLEDGVSKLQLERRADADDTRWQVIMHEGRNRQIRRTFEAIGYQVRQLHRTRFGEYHLKALPVGKYIPVKPV